MDHAGGSVDAEVRAHLSLLVDLRLLDPRHVTEGMCHE